MCQRDMRIRRSLCLFLYILLLFYFTKERYNNSLQYLSMSNKSAQKEKIASVIERDMRVGQPLTIEQEPF